ncbi:MAG TPA: amidohydrolase family protein [Rhodanobacteraceae bacterium]|nr:amidohydrolase family protein [Rhodanobacteraceae bacterium]
MNRIWIVVLSIAASLPAQAARPVVAITDVAVVDVGRGRAIGPRTVLIEDGRIASIDAPASARIPDGAERIDGKGRFLIPGLVDLHVHLFNNASKRPPNTWTFPLFVANGITGVREMAGTPQSMATVKAWRKAFDDGTLVAPRVLAAGVVDWGSSPEEAKQRVDEAADAGADFIKVFSELPEAEWRAGLAEAERRSLPLLGHVPAGVTLLDAARAGQHDNEHLMQAFEACSTIERAMLDERQGLAGNELGERRDAEESRVLDAFDRRTCERVARELAKTHQAQVPTLVLAYVESQPARPAADDPRWKYLRADERARWLRIAETLTTDERAVAARRWAVARRIAASFHAAGVPLLAGTDTPMPNVYPGWSLHDELERLVDSGLSPAEALRAATLGPATLLGIADRSGTVAAGKRADLVLLDADPLRDIRNTRRIDAVVLDGRPFTREALDGLLSDAAKAAAN